MNQEQSIPEQQAARNPAAPAVELQTVLAEHVLAEHENLKCRALALYNLVIKHNVDVSSPEQSILHAHLALLGKAVGVDVPPDLVAYADLLAKAWEFSQLLKDRAKESKGDDNDDDNSISCTVHKVPEAVMDRILAKIVESAKTKD